MKRYAYTSDVKKLRNAGYIYQKSCGRSYCKDSITMYSRSKMMIEISHLSPELRTPYIEFILTNKDKPEHFWVRDEDLTMNPAKPITFNNAPIWFLTAHGRVMNCEAFYDMQMPITNLKIQTSSDCRNGIISKEEYDLKLEELRKNEFYWDPVVFSLDNVKLIIELDNLHPLELIER